MEYYHGKSNMSEKKRLDTSWLDMLMPNTKNNMNDPNNDYHLLTILDFLVKEGIDLDQISHQGSRIKLKGRNFESSEGKFISFRNKDNQRHIVIARDYYFFEKLQLLFYFTDRIITLDEMQHYENYGYPENVFAVFLPMHDFMPDQSIVCIERNIEKNIKNFFVNEKLIHFAESIDMNEIPQVLIYIIDFMSQLMIDRLQF